MKVFNVQEVSFRMDNSLRFQLQSVNHSLVIFDIAVFLTCRHPFNGYCLIDTS